MSGRLDSGLEDGVIAPSQQSIITIDDEDFNSEEEQGGDPGVFATINTLEKKSAHLAIFLHYLISNSDPSSLFFYIVSDMYSHAQGSVKDLRKWAYEIHSTFLVRDAPLIVELEPMIVNTIDCILTQSSNESSLRPVFELAKNAVKAEIAELLSDFCSKKDLGLGSIYGVHELEEVMDKSKEQKLIDKYLSPHLERCTKENLKQDRDKAIGWSLVTFLRYVGYTKNLSVERTQSFVMKDKRVIKLPGKSNKTKQFKGHVFNLTHYTASTFCHKCHGLIWGVGTQGYQCQVCEMNVHKQCSEDVDTCAGKQKKGERDKDKKRALAVIPVFPSSGRKQSNPNKDAGNTSSAVQDALRESTSQEFNVVTQPAKKDEDADFTLVLSQIAGLPVGHGVKSIIQRYEDGPQSPDEASDDTAGAQGKDRELGRSESMKNRGEVTKSKKSDRPARRAKSDVDMDENAIKALNQSGSSSTSSLSNRSVESPSTSSETMNDMILADSDLDLEPELPSLKKVLGEDIIKKLSTKEKKRQEVLNELFYTERAHVRALKILDKLFHRPMKNEGGTYHDLARSLFPNVVQMIELHSEMNNQMKLRRADQPIVKNIADIFLKRFDGENGEIFRQACAEYCRNQAHALDTLKKHQRKEQRLSQFLNEQESSPLCRRFQLKDLLPAQMQRLTKYPLLIENLMKHTQASSEEYSLLEKARDRSKQILAYVNQAVKDCENWHKLRNLQKRLDKRPLESLSSHHSYEEMKHLELTDHKLVYDGILSLKLPRLHRRMDVHVVLLEDIMVLLQKENDKLVLCQSREQSARGDDRDKYINTHSPLLKLQNLLARNVATTEKAFFVVNTENTGPQIYEFIAPTRDERKKWVRYINESVDDVGKRENKSFSFYPPPPAPSIAPPSGESETISIRRDQIRVTTSPHNRHSNHVSVDALSVDLSRSSTSTLVPPGELDISDTTSLDEPEPVLSPIEKLRRNDQTLESALEERGRIMAEIHSFGHDDCGLIPPEVEEAAAVGDVVMDDSSMSLISAAQNIASILTNLVITSSASTSHSAETVTAEPPKMMLPIPMTQLKDMATRMNQILTKLLTAVQNQDDEKDSLREELRQAQEKLNTLKQIQRAAMGGGISYTSPSSRPSSIVSVGSSVNDDGSGDTEPSVLEVADNLREQAQEVMRAVGLQPPVDEVTTVMTPTLQTQSPVNRPDVKSDTPLLDTASVALESDGSDHDEPVPPPTQCPDNLGNEPSNDDVVDNDDIFHDVSGGGDEIHHDVGDGNDVIPHDVCVENSKNHIVSAGNPFANLDVIDSVMSQEMLNSTLTTDLDEGVDDSESESTTPTAGAPDLGFLGETDTNADVVDCKDRITGSVLIVGSTVSIGGVTADEVLVSIDNDDDVSKVTSPLSVCDEDNNVTPTESAVDPVVI